MAGNALVVILGPTAVGKTGLAIDLAEAVGGEIVGADSRQIYRFMDIGTAKPTPEQRQRVVHHLIDIADPDEDMALARFQRMAYDVIDAVQERGHVPLLVGGTGQYITAIVEGWSIPEVPPNTELRAELEQFARDKGSEALHQRLAELDPDAAQSIDHRNVRRVIRALEVCLETGERFSQLQIKRPPPYRIVYYGLTLERERLYQQADQRVNQMMQDGFLDEVRRLLDMGYDRRLPSMSGLGYRHLAEHFLDGVPLETAVQNTKFDTHQFIRRQYTWFKGHDPGILWHNRDEINLSEMILNLSRWIQS